MAEVSGVPSVPDQSTTQPVDQTTANTSAGTVSASLPANATMGDLERVAPPLAAAIKFAIASNSIEAQKRSQQRIHDTLKDAEQQQKS